MYGLMALRSLSMACTMVLCTLNYWALNSHWCLSYKSQWIECFVYSVSQMRWYVQLVMATTGGPDPMPVKKCWNPPETPIPVKENRLLMTRLNSTKWQWCAWWFNKCLMCGGRGCRHCRRWVPFLQQKLLTIVICHNAHIIDSMSQ